MRDRSLFWPIVFIGVGAIWLLVNANLIPPVNWLGLLRLWPLLLIAAGLEVLVGRRSPLASALIGLATVGAAVALVYLAPRLNLPGSQVRTDHFSEPIGEAASAEITLDLSAYPVEVSSAAGSGTLIDAEISTTGETQFEASGTSTKTVLVGTRQETPFSFDWLGPEDHAWRIGLSGAIPLELSVDVGSGATTLDLAGLTLAGLAIDGGSGAVSLALPASETAYEASIDGGSGAWRVTVPAGAEASLSYDGGSGSLTVELAAGAAARVEVRDSGSGSVRLPAGWETVSRGDGDEGVWQTPGLDNAGSAFTLVIDGMGSGSVAVR